MVELGGFPYAWRAVEWATEDRDVQRAAHWTRTATTLQCAAAGGAVRASDDLFAPFHWDRASSGFCDDATVMIQAEDYDAASSVLGAASYRMGLVNTMGHEYADEREQEDLEDSLPSDDDWKARTVNYIGGGGEHPLGPWVRIDNGIGGELTTAMMSTMLAILIEEVKRIGLSGAVLRSGRRAASGDHTPAHAVSTPDDDQALLNGGDDSIPLTFLVGDTMRADHVLTVGASITSTNGRYTLIHHGDGNLVLHGPAGARWASNAPGEPGRTCIMQSDGNLVLYGAADLVLWSSNTGGNPGSRLTVQDDGNAVIYSPDGTPVWASGTWVMSEPAATGDGMQPGEILAPGASITSRNGRYGLAYLANGNLVLRGPGGYFWTSDTAGQPAGFCVMQEDGNLVLYAPGGTAVWASGTHGNGGSHLTLQDDGNAIIHRPDGTTTWESSTRVLTGPVATGSGMQSGDVLNPGDVIRSANGRYAIYYGLDGDLVLHRTIGTPLWASNTAGMPVGVCVMQGDGNLVLCAPGGAVVWASGTHGNPGSHLTLQDDGNVVIIRPDGTPAWESGTGTFTGPRATGDTMQPGETLAPSDAIQSDDWRYRFVLHGATGNLSLYGPDGLLWVSGTDEGPPGVCVMHDDGNLALYAPGGAVLWASGTHGNPGSHLIIRNDGNAIIYRPDGTPIWESGTGQH